MASQDPQSDQAYLKEEFLRDARVLDLDRGYISASAFNLRMKPAVLAAAARLIAAEFKDEIIDIVHGIPHSGNYLATAVALALDNGHTRLHSSRKDQNVPTTWKDIFRQEVRSFTTSNGGMNVFSGINLSFVQKGDRVLIIDDVCATGETGTAIVSGLLKNGIKVAGFAVLFDKVFQGGLAQVSALGIKAYSCIRIASIDKGDAMALL